MDESEKRRDRLKAMRMEAAQVEVSNDVETSAVSSSLSNPLIEPSATLSVQEESCATPRFDFYTDPMSAFSANKKRSKDGNHNRQDYYTPPSYSGSPMARISSSLPGSMNPELTPSSAYQLQSNYSHERIYQPQGPYNNAAPHGSPRGMANPFPMHQGTPEAWNGSGHTAGYYSSGPNNSHMANPFPMHQGTPEAWNGSGHTAGYYSSGPHNSHMANPFPMQQGTPEALDRSGSYSFQSNPSIGTSIPSPGCRPMGSPRFNYGQGRAHWLGNSPSPSSGYLGSPGPGSGYRGSPGPGSGYPGSPGRGSGYRGSPGPGSGRGRGRWYSGNMSPGSGRGGGRGAGFHNRDSGQRLGPECFFDKSMVEDPWQHLEPILWKGLHDSANSLKSHGSSNSWLPKSISMKKARVSEASNNSSPQPSLAKHLAEASNKSSPQPSLAEYLAASFNEAINDTPSA